MARVQCGPMRGWRSCIHRTCAHSFPGLSYRNACSLVPRSFRSFSYRLFSEVYLPFRRLPHTRARPSLFLSPLPLSCFLSLLPLPLCPLLLSFCKTRVRTEGGAVYRSSCNAQKQLPIDTAVPLQVVNETALLRAASLSAIVRHCRIDVYRLLSRADNNIWITTECTRNRASAFQFLPCSRRLYAPAILSFGSFRSGHPPPPSCTLSNPRWANG